jgi:hypothetical protein
MQSCCVPCVARCVFTLLSVGQDVGSCVFCAQYRLLIQNLNVSACKKSQRVTALHLTRVVSRRNATLRTGFNAQAQLVV